MKRLLLAGLLACLFATGSGCAMCSNNWDEAYGAYGGKQQRADQFHGRVNSAYQSAGGMSSGETIVEESTGSQWVREGSLEPAPEMMGR